MGILYRFQGAVDTPWGTGMLCGALYGSWMLHGALKAPWGPSREKYADHITSPAFFLAITGQCRQQMHLLARVRGAATGLVAGRRGPV